MPAMPTHSTFEPSALAASLPLSEVLAHADALLHCASAVAYESADQRHGQSRHLALSVVHLVDMARALVVRSLEQPADGEDAPPTPGSE